METSITGLHLPQSDPGAAAPGDAIVGVSRREAGMNGG